MKNALIGLVLSTCAAHGQQVYDLLLKNGQAPGGAPVDVAVSGNKIARIARDLPAAHARVTIDAAGYLVTPGLIDINTHAPADYNTLPNGVTTAVDNGSSTCTTFPDFKKRVIDHRRTRLLAMVAGEEADCAKRYPDVIAGVRLVPVYSRAGTPIPDLIEARKRGVLFDANLGSDGLWFRLAKPAVAQGFLPDTISSGMNRENILIPRANMLTVMSEFLNLGMTPEQITERVTANPARILHRPELGVLKEGGIADIVVLQIEQGRFGFLDSGHARLDGTRRFRCVLTVRNGAVVWDSEGLSIPDTSKAGPYSNFK